MKKWLLITPVVVIALLWILYWQAVGIQVHVSAPLTGQLISHQLSVAKLPRQFNYYLPEKISLNPALVFVLHGSTRNGATIRYQTAYQFDSLANRKDFIVVYPDGYEGHWNDCRASASYSANQLDIDDPAFLKAMINYFVTRYGVDPARVFASGFSNGGHMAYRLGLEMADHFAAIAAIAANLPVADNLDCETQSKPLSVAIFNGDKDPINPYHGGVVDVGGETSRGRVLSSTASAEYWAGLAGLDSISSERLEEQDQDTDTGVLRMTWTATAASNPSRVQLYTLRGSGHVIPSRHVSFGSYFGGNAADIEVAEEITDFFQL